ncbi:MAG: undecaprenyldiphospho-muramoylpentapeptide beta-N-acetylglucosaminyltransferase [Gammaproteobacteria bacterium]|nr:undecaprenyldiphospho-muramoylpentapeptide beta-N-acetylglucosaminyltransferase [Gammaproteobacteria bacterium]
MTACVLIMAGGTGGHVFPGLAVADELRARGVDVVWLGSRGGMEAELVAKAGVEMECISISGLRGKGIGGWLLAPFRLATALIQSLAVIMRRRPAVILGMGGFVAGPGGVMSWLLRKPLLIHEQNAIAGLTNKLLAKLATKVLEAFPGTFSARENVIEIGNPVRAVIAALPEPAVRLAQRPARLRLLIVGGSLGAQGLNEVVPQAVAKMAPELRPEIWHQAGKRNIDATCAQYQTLNVEGRVEPFIDDMAAAYGWTDLVLCRSGALTVSELAAAGVAAVLVPFPFAVDDHQTANAAYLANAGAAILVQQRDLSAAGLQALLEEFARDCQTGRERLLAMAQNARRKAMPSAATRVADICLEVARA